MSVRSAATLDDAAALSAEAAALRRRLADRDADSTA
jgi:hypothetical protein